MAKIAASKRKCASPVGERIKRQRKLQRLTQEQLAEKVGGSFSAKNLSRYENGEAQMGINTYFEIAKALGVSPNDLAPQELLPDSTTHAGPEGYYELDEDNKQIINTMIAMLLQKQKKQQ